MNDMDPAWPMYVFVGIILLGLLAWGIYEFRSKSESESEANENDEEDEDGCCK